MSENTYEGIADLLARLEDTADAELQSPGRPTKGTLYQLRGLMVDLRKEVSESEELLALLVDAVNWCIYRRVGVTDPSLGAPKVHVRVWDLADDPYTDPPTSIGVGKHAVDALVDAFIKRQLYEAKRNLN